MLQMAKDGVKRTPLQYLEDILERALGYELIMRDEIAHLLQQEANIQQNIDAWRPLVRQAENEPKREWVLTTLSFLHGAAVNERVDEVVCSNYSEACDRCRAMNISTGTSALKMKKCKVVEKKDSIGCGEGSGRSCLQLLAPQQEVGMPEEKGEGGGEGIDWDDLLGHGNGYLPLRNKNVVAADVPGIIESIILAGGLVTQLGLSQNTLKGPGTVCLVSDLLQPTPDSCFQNISALYLSNNSIGDEGALVIAELIASRQLPIVKVGLNSNGITDVGARAIAKTLVTSATDNDDYTSLIEVLGLSHNQITAAGASCIAQAVTKNCSIQRLFLNYNSEVGEVGGCALAAAAEGHPSLLRLGVAFCSLSSASGEALMKTLLATDRMERICVSGNCFDEATENLMEQMSRFNFAEVK
jgi:hypothetical protein